jgi:caffeoyl-CoA O-methyltransferase
VDKEDYPRVLRLVPPRLRRGGLFITDNVLWRGQVAEEVKDDERASVIAEFNRQLYTSKDFFTTILPLRDGVSVATRT